MSKSIREIDGAPGFTFGRDEIVSLIVWVGIVLVAMAIGQWATFSSLQSWYPSLNKPSFNPPNWIFGPVWGALYLMMAVSAWLGWQSRSEESIRTMVKQFTIAFLIQLILNVLWSIVFFGFRSPQFAFVEICILWLAIAVTIVLAFRISKLSGWLLVPYLCWVSFAAALNFQIWRLN